MNATSVRQPRHFYLAVTLLVLLGAALRFFRIGELPLRADEAMTLFFATDLSTILQQVTTTDPHQPIYYFMLHGWLAVAGSTEMAERFPTLFASVLVIPLTFVLARTVFPRQPRVALWGTLLTAVNPYLIWDAQDAYIYTFLTALSLGSFILFLLAVGPLSTTKTWIKYVIVSVLDLFFHYFAGLILFAEGALLVLLVLRKRASLRQMIHFLMAGVAIGALYAPWLFLAWSVLTSYSSDFLLRASLTEMASRTLVAFTLGRYDNRLMPAMIDPVIGNLLALIFLALFVVGLAAPIQNQAREPEGRLILAGFLGTPLFIVFAFSLWRFPIFDERYVLYLAPAFLLFVARGVNSIYELPKAGLAGVVAAAVIVMASGFSLYDYWYVPAFAKSPDWPGFVARIASDSQSGDLLIQNYPDPALPYYLKDRIPRVLLPRSSAQEATDLSADLVRLTTRYDRVWFQPAPNSTWDTEGLVATWLARHARLVSSYDLRGARLELYLTTTTALRDAERVGAVLDNRIQLAAFEFDQGNPMLVRLYWQPISPLDRDYTVFVHLYSSDGKLIAQKDSTPINGTFPTTQWKANETIVDSYEVIVPSDAPSGAYMLMAGMYDSQTQVRLSVVDNQGRPYADNRVLLANVTLAYVPALDAPDQPLAQAQLK